MFPQLRSFDCGVTQLFHSPEEISCSTILITHLNLEFFQNNLHIAEQLSSLLHVCPQLKTTFAYKGHRNDFLTATFCLTELSRLEHIKRFHFEVYELIGNNL